MRNVKLHYMPIVYSISILFSLGLAIGLAYNVIGYSYMHEEQYIEQECWSTNNQNEPCDWREVTRTHVCTFDLLDFTKDCNQSNYSSDWWLLGIALFGFISAIWYVGLFYCVNDSKKWVKFEWVE